MTEYLPPFIQSEDAARLIVPHLLSAYAAGELSFIEATARCARAVDVRGMPTAKRQALLGAAVEAMLSVKQKTNREARRARPLWLCRACSELVDVISEREGLPLSRPVSGRTAYERAAEILNAHGIIGMTPVTVTKARADWKLHTTKAASADAGA